jgi:hypothetical protein
VLAADPSNAMIYWAGTDEGGVYRTTNGATSWLPASVGIDHLTVNAVVVDPTDRNTLWAATEVGVYRSTTAGATWAVRSMFLPDRKPVATLAVDPGMPTTIWAASPDIGLWQSTNTGQNWMQLPLAAKPTIIVIDAKNPMNMYLGTSDNGVLRSTDRGMTFSLANAGLVGGVSRLYIDAENPRTLYALDLDVKRSIDAGDLWTKVSNGFLSVDELAADPSKGGTLYMRGTDDQFFFPGNYRSIDGGQNWSPISGLNGMTIERFAPAPSGGGRVIYATDGDKVLLSRDGALSWTDLMAPSDYPASGLDISRLTSLTVDPLDASVLFVGVKLGDGVLRYGP